jgi:peptidoglycan/xylan/chitin deacetylase (PgdA/CDA1 family)
MEEIGTRGILVISLDFELYWGVRDKRTIAEYSDNLMGARKVIPVLLDLFKKYTIHATWATVGFLFFSTIDELMAAIPKITPPYQNSKLNSYDELKVIGKDENDDPYHYAMSLMNKIHSYPDQEIGTHTFSHYYCMEGGQTIESFEEDLHAAIRVGEKRGIHIHSLVFPRNQYNEDYLEIAEKFGITSFRGNQKSWIYKEKKEEDYTLVFKALRFLDAHINITGNNSYPVSEIARKFPFNIPASRFLYPCSPKLKMLQFLRMKRIFSDMKYAAENNEVYHLWWHPHNFGSHSGENIQMLTEILEYFSYLRNTYGMKSYSMGELAAMLRET